MCSDFPHFEIYYVTLSKSFVKSADCLVLFYHWCLIQNRFKCLNDGQISEMLKDTWNTSVDSYYDLNYCRTGINFRLEVYVISDILHIQIRRLSDMMDTTQQVQIVDFLNDGVDYKTESYKKVFKDLNLLYKRFQWSIDHIKPLKAVKPKDCTVIARSSTGSSASNQKELGITSTYADIINQIKNEKQGKEIERENLRRDSSNTQVSVSSTTSSSSIIIVQPNIVVNKNRRLKKTTAKSLKIKDHLKKSIDSETDISLPAKTHQVENEVIDVLAPISNSIINEIEVFENTNNTVTPKCNASGTRKELFDYNPITNYFNYNKGAEETRLIDEKNINEDEFVKKSFEKYNLKLCTVNLNDFFKMEQFKNSTKTTSIKLNEKFKQDLNLTNKNAKNYKTKCLKNNDVDRIKKGSRNNLRSSRSESLDINLIDSDKDSTRDSLSSNDLHCLRLRRKRNRIDSDSLDLTEENKETSQKPTESTLEAVISDVIENKNEKKTSPIVNATSLANLRSQQTKARKINEFFQLNQRKTGDLLNTDVYTFLGLTSEEEHINSPVKTTINCCIEKMLSNYQGDKENDMIAEKSSEYNHRASKRLKSSISINDSLNEKQLNNIQTSPSKNNETNQSTNLKMSLKTNNFDTPSKKSFLTTSSEFNSTIASFIESNSIISPKSPSKGFIAEFLKTFNLTLTPKVQINNSNEEVDLNATTPISNIIETTLPTNNNNILDKDDDCSIIEVISRDIRPFGIIKIEKKD